MNPIRYKTACNCEVEKSGIKKVRLESNTNLTVCREHGGKVLYRVRECIDCGDDYELETRGPGGMRCATCAKAEQARRRKINNANRYRQRNANGNRIIRKMKAWSYNRRGDYCTGVNACRMRGELECDDCGRFIGVYFGYDPGRMVA